LISFYRAFCIMLPKSLYMMMHWPWWAHIEHFL
jgi:hypothetical protein